MTITSMNQIRDLLGLVHDRWFNVERIALDKERETVAIHLEENRKNLDEDSKDGLRLLIRNAQALTINDTERVRDYDLNEIDFDAKGGRVIITCGIPLTIEVKVTALNIETVEIGQS